MSEPSRLGRVSPDGRAQATIARPGENCQVVRRADRVAFLVDAAAYYAAFFEAAQRAERSIVIVGWDIDSRIPLVRDDAPGDWPTTFGPFLAALVRAKRGLHVRVLGWEYPLLFAREREPDPYGGFWGSTPRRIEFHLDGTYTGLASCHQKMVVIDDRLAFAGGMDLTRARWDTPEHLETDPRRVDPTGRAYPPVHDVMMAVDGAAARALGDLARDRWFCATERRVRPVTVAGDPWPPSLVPDVTGVAVAISRTMPATGRGGPAAVREVERLFLDMIAAARTSIYIENQFFTSSVIGDAIAARLAEPDGPEVVLVISREAMSWLEEATMGVLRHRLVARLHEHDRYGRFRVYDPVSAGARRLGIKVHSKVMIVDDALLRVGSANVNNRSLGLDPECDLMIEACGEPHAVEAIRAFRDRLLGEHLGASPPAVRDALREHGGSLVSAIEALRGGERTLEPLASGSGTLLDEFLPGEDLVDPDTPLEAEAVLDQLLPEEGGTPRWRRPAALGTLLFALALALTAAWRWTPLSGFIHPSRLAAIAGPWAWSPLGPVVVVVGYLLTGLIGVPVNVLIFATGLAFGPRVGLAYAVLGFMGSAIGMYGIGAALGRRFVTRLAGHRLQRVATRLNRHGFLAVAALRAIPVAPYVVVNLVAGASRVRFRSYVIGTFVGMLPGTVVATLFGGHLGEFLHHPSTGHLVIVLAIVALMVALMVLVRKWLGRPEPHVAGG